MGMSLLWQRRVPELPPVSPRCPCHVDGQALYCAVKSKLLEVVEKVVEFSYPDKRGIQKLLEDRGWRIWWSRPEEVASYVDIENAELVTERDSQGMLSRFRTYDGLVS